MEIWHIIGYMTFRPMQFQPMPFQPLPFQPLPFQPLPFQPLPFQPLPFQPLPFQPLPFQPLPFQPLPFQPLPFQPLPFQPLPFQPLTISTYCIFNLLQFRPINRFKKFARLGTSLLASDAIASISATTWGKRASDALAKLIYHFKDANPYYANSAIARIFSIYESTLRGILKRGIRRSGRQKKSNWVENLYSQNESSITWASMRFF